MLERLIDATRTAADCVHGVCRAMVFEMVPEPRVLVSLIRSLHTASASAYQLGHAQQNPAFFAVRDQMDDIAKSVTAAAGIRNARVGIVMTLIGQALDRLWHEAQAMATARPVARQDVLAMVDERQRNVVVH